jgi:hypothetical protein
MTTTETQIKASDLRYGNWVLLTKDNDMLPVIKIDGDEDLVTLDLLMGYNVALSIEEISPIPLTPEILEKAGFENNGRLSKRITGKISLIAMELLNECFVSLQIEGVCGAEIGISVSYLHQLQNIYFCLCGEELDINL